MHWLGSKNLPSDPPGLLRLRRKLKVHRDLKISGVRRGGAVVTGSFLLYI